MTSGPADSPSIEAGNADSRGKRTVWNVPNGTIEVNPVVDAASWPALSESTKSSSDSLKSPSDSGLVTSSSSSPKATTPNSGSNPNFVKNSIPPTRQKSLKQGCSSVNNASLQLVSAPEPSPRSSSSGSNEQYRAHNNGNRRGNNGGGSHQNHGAREWNNRNSSHMNRGGFRTYHRPQHFMPPPPPLPHPIAGGAMGYAEFPSPIYYVAPQQYPEAIRGMPFVPHQVPHAMFFPSLDPQRAALLKQIEYYFSSENLCKDVYLRSQMDEQGWVHITLIASFPKVRKLTNNIQYILETIRFSSFVEVQGEKIRRRNDWMNWRVLPINHTTQPTNPAHPNSAAGISAVATQLQNASINEASTAANSNSHSDVAFTRSASGSFLDSRSLSRCDTF